MGAGSGDGVSGAGRAAADRLLGPDYRPRAERGRCDADPAPRLAPSGDEGRFRPDGAPRVAAVEARTLIRYAERRPTSRTGSRRDRLTCAARVDPKQTYAAFVVKAV